MAYRTPRIATFVDSAQSKAFGHNLFKSLKLSGVCVFALGMSMGATAPAQAQDSGEGEALEEIVITGSRIVRRDFEANSPIVTVDQELFDQSASAAIETQLNQLPQFSPTVDVPSSGGDIQPNARNTPGEATISLRGLGQNRSLVLINGRRATPSNASMTVDINSIPSVALERVEAISGGASATYGADAMAGVVNFILRDDFQGVELDVQSGVTQEGDNFEYQLSGIVGSDFADGDGNVSVAFSTNDRNSAHQRDRGWYQDLWADPSIGGTGFFPPLGGIDTENPNVFSPFPNRPDPDVVNEVIGGGTFEDPPANTEIYADPSGNVFSGFNPDGVPGAVGADPIVDGERFVRLDNGQIGVNFTDNLLVLPLKRYNMFSQGNYEINDWIGVFAQGYFSKTTTRTVQEPAPITEGWSVTIDDPTMHEEAIPDGIYEILQSRPFPDAPFSLRGLLPLNRTSETDVFTYNITAGLEGEIPSTDWTWEVFAQQGEAETTVIQRGFGSLQRLRAVLNGAPNFGQGFEQTSNSGLPDFGFAGTTATCTSGFNIFQPDTISQDCMDAISADIRTKQVMQQTIYQANLQGALVDLPAGEVRAAVGASYRENDYVFQNDTLVSQGTSFLEQAIGLFPSGNSAGTIDVSELYGELLIPIVSDTPGIQELNLELGGRVSDYNTTGTSYTFKTLADWRVTDSLRIRGGFNRAERAPNVAELFLAPEQSFAFSAGGDVCSTNNLQPWSANADVNDNWQEVVEMCGMLMEASGNPDADEAFYGIPWQDVAAGADPTNAQGTGGTFLFPTTRGNDALAPEKADTWTVGVVLDSPFQSPVLSDLRVSIDYYNIKVKDAIGEQSADIVMRQCVDPAFNPDFDINSPFCSGFNRDSNGFIGNLERTFFNNGRFKTSGIDFQVNWGMEAGPGRVNVSALFNYLIDMKSAELPTDPMVDFAGTFGPSANGLNGNSYRYQSLTTLTYSIDGLSLGVEWQHLPSIDQEAAATANTPVQGAPSYNKFDLQGSYQVTADLGVRFGVENVFNKRPPLIGRNPAAELPNLPGGMFDGQNYDTNGRRFYLGARANF